MSGAPHLGADGAATPSKGQTTYVDAIREGIREEMQRDERVFLLGEDIGVYGGAFKVTDGLIAEFGEAHGLPREATRGGAATALPEFAETLR